MLPAPEEVARLSVTVDAGKDAIAQWESRHQEAVRSRGRRLQAKIADQQRVWREERAKEKVGSSLLSSETKV